MPSFTFPAGPFGRCGHVRVGEDRKDAFSDAQIIRGHLFERGPILMTVRHGRDTTSPAFVPKGGAAMPPPAASSS